MKRILTAQPDALGLALREAGDPAVLRMLAAGVCLAEGGRPPAAPVFLRHQCPADCEVPLTGGAEDIARLREAFAPLLAAMGPECGTYSVQTRILDGYQPAYKRYDVNMALSGQAGAAGLSLDVKSPARIVSVTLAGGAGWLGVSTPAENISDWAGGMRRFKWEEGQISRAEFKLLEALEVFGIAPVDGGRAIDLGAAPGGWTRVLRRRGLAVDAVDPAALDARLSRDGRIRHHRMTAQAYFRASPAPCDLLVSDMKMDSLEAAQLVAGAADFVKPGGNGILTLKLPEDAGTWAGRVEAAMRALADGWTVTGARQLFHNRSEVTVALATRRCPAPDCESICRTETAAGPGRS